uniref:(northern house mosquito) hypothetical protein n=1 Tax=Culex pipiens TaxID=7175 RepID=A0A8D8IDW5_CULPI
MCSGTVWSLWTLLPLHVRRVRILNLSLPTKLSRLGLHRRLTSPVQRFDPASFAHANALQPPLPAEHLLRDPPRLLHRVDHLLLRHVLLDVLPRVRLRRRRVQLLPRQDRRPAVLRLLLRPARHLGHPDRHVQRAAPVRLPAPHARSDPARLWHRTQQAVPVGVPSPGPDGHLPHLRQLGPPMSQNEEVFPLTELPCALPARRQRPRHGWPRLLRVPPDQAKLPHRPLDLAHGDGPQHPVPAPEPQDLPAKVLAYGYDLPAELVLAVVQLYVYDDARRNRHHRRNRCRCHHNYVDVDSARDHPVRLTCKYHYRGDHGQCQQQHVPLLDVLVAGVGGDTGHQR